MTVQEIDIAVRIFFCVVLFCGVVLFFIWLERTKRTGQLRRAIKWYSEGHKSLACQEVVHVLSFNKLKYMYLLPHEKKQVESMKAKYKFGMDYK